MYANNIIVKFEKLESHIHVLRKFFDRLGKYKLRLNPAKCLFGVKSEKLLGFMVSDKWIKVDLDKLKVIQSMSSPKIEKKMRGLLGRLDYIS